MTKTESDWSILYRICSFAELVLCCYLCNYAIVHYNDIEWWKWVIIVPCAVGQIIKSYFGIKDGLTKEKRDEIEGNSKR